MQTSTNASQNPSTTQERLINLDEVESITGFKSSYIYSKIQKGLFPQPVKIGTTSRWRESQVLAWVHAQIESGTSGKRAEVRA
ncbi:MAG: AlpA family phage regulatory protein [Nitrosomonas sp.]|nr:AlpA family phage regulatory protein [Nitrosomonas sp.]OQW82704.1 MAG: hypothetical protein BVN30_08180 [Proteobacteria bacterium ST_bin16]TXI35498.1 MAG: AlpA family phage regulatory protein [Nitrosomonas sp.]